MTCLKDLRDDINFLIEKHGEDSPCFYTLWCVDDFQQYKQQEHVFYLEDMRRYNDEPLEDVQARLAEFKPWTDEEMVVIAERMMSNYNPAKEFIAYNDAVNEMTYDRCVKQEEDF